MYTAVFLKVPYYWGRISNNPSTFDGVGSAAVVGGSALMGDVSAGAEPALCTANAALVTLSEAWSTPGTVEFFLPATELPQ